MPDDKKKRKPIPTLPNIAAAISKLAGTPEGYGPGTTGRIDGKKEPLSSRFIRYFRGQKDIDLPLEKKKRR